MQEGAGHDEMWAWFAEKGAWLRAGATWAVEWGVA